MTKLSFLKKEEIQKISPEKFKNQKLEEWLNSNIE